MEAMTTTAEVDRRGNQDDHDYDRYVERVQDRFRRNTADGKEPLFTTDVDRDALWTAYLEAFPTEERQYHNCSACRGFIKTIGALVTIGTDGRTAPAAWDAEDAPELYRTSVEAMLRLIRRAKVTGVWLSSESPWGKPLTRRPVDRPWRHFAVTPPKSMVYVKTVLTARQKMAERREDFGQVQRALEEFSAATVQQAVTLLKTDSLYRSEKVLGPAQFLADLHAAIEANKGNRANTVWRAIAAAPAGFCHPRSSMVGTLLEDIAAGLSFEDASRKFRDKMHPLQYQRPQAAPSAGAIAAAEKRIAELGAAGSLARRFARLEEVEALWKPAAVEAPKASGSVFGHLVPKGEAEPTMTVPAQTMTWDKFSRTVLPTAKAIELLAPNIGNYSALLTAVNADAPPILQWDSEERRNPVSWYVYNGGSAAPQWGVVGGQWTKVTAVTLQPSQWYGAKLSHQGESVLFLLDGAKDSRGAYAGAGLFPEILKSEFHAMRSTIEAFSRSAKLEGYEEATACGLRMQKGSREDIRLRVTDGTGTRLEYRLDRWD
jgi:hypothetical protein